MAGTVPSQIIAQYIVTSGAFNSASSKTWPLYRSHLPDGANVPDNAACIYDTSGYLQAKSMRGNLYQRFGIQITLRCTNPDNGYKKLAGLLKALEPITNIDVVISGSAFRIRNVSQTTAITPMGIETDAKQRYYFSANLLVSLKEM